MGKKNKAAKSEKHTKGPEAPIKGAEEIPHTAAPIEPAKSGRGRLDDRQITLISKALADPTRMAVLRAIAQGGATCGDLRNCAQISAATLSHHMKELENAGLIETERKGRFLNSTLQRKVWKSYVSELKSLVE